MRVHVVHGIHTSLGPNWLRGFVPLLQAAGFEAVYIDYGWIYGLETKVANPLIVHTMLQYIEPGDLFIGHSNGCAIGYDLMGLKAPLAGAVFINAALEQNIVRPAQVKWIDIYYNAGDEITECANLAEELGLVDPIWGEMGHAGYSGKDPAIKNYNCGESPPLPVLAGHSDMGTAEKFAQWGPYVIKQLQSHLQILKAA